MCFFISLDSSQSAGEFEKELELLTSLTVKEANHNPLLNNAMNNQGTCHCRKKNNAKTRSVSHSYNLATKDELSRPQQALLVHLLIKGSQPHHFATRMA